MSIEDDKDKINANLVSLHESARQFRNRSISKQSWAYFNFLVGVDGIDTMFSDADVKIRIVCGLVGFTALVNGLRLNKGVLEEMEHYSSRMEDAAVEEYRFDQLSETDNQ
jgi:hypothetical protein